MAWSGNIIPTQFKADLLRGVHNLDTGGDSYKGALYDNSITPATSDTVYNTTGEITGTGYTAGGAALSQNAVATSGTTAFIDFQDVSWSTATFTAYGLKIYNTGAGAKANKLIGEFDFGGAKPVAGGTFTVVFPTPDASNALIRLA